MFYKVLQADGIATRYVKSIALLSNGDQERVYGCIPNGAIGISVVLNGSCCIRQNNAMEPQPKMFVYGLVKHVQWHSISPGYREVTIVFHPHYLQLLLKERLSDFEENQAIGLNDLFARSITDQLYEALLLSTTDDEIVNAVDSFIDKAIQSKALDPRIKAAHDLIYEKKIRKVEDISSRLNVSAIRLRELFRDYVGVSPKELIKIRRINEAFRIREHKEDSLTSLAYKLDYFDQAHFIHDFKEVTGLTPKQYFSNKKLSSDFYNFGRWDHSSFI